MNAAPAMASTQPIISPASMTYTQGQEDRQKRATRGHRADTLTLRRIRRDGERASARERGKAWEAPMEVRLHMIIPPPPMRLRPRARTVRKSTDAAASERRRTGAGAQGRHPAHTKDLST